MQEENNIIPTYIPNTEIVKKETNVEIIKEKPTNKRRNFSTKWFEVLNKVGEKNGLTVDEMEDELINTLFERAKSGDYKFLKDILDRVYGKPIETHELTGKDGKDLAPDLSEVQKVNLIKLIQK